MTRRASSFDSMARSFAESSPRALVIAGEPAMAAQVYSGLRAAGYDGAIVYDRAGDREFRNALPASAADIVWADSWSLSQQNPASRDFTLDFVQRYGEVPDAYAAAAYDAVMLVRARLRYARRPVQRHCVYPWFCRRARQLESRAAAQRRDQRQCRHHAADRGWRAAHRRQLSRWQTRQRRPARAALDRLADAFRYANAARHRTPTGYHLVIQTAIKMSAAVRAWSTMSSGRRFQGRSCGRWVARPTTTGWSLIIAGLTAGWLLTWSRLLASTI